MRHDRRTLLSPAVFTAVALAALAMSGPRDLAAQRPPRSAATVADEFQRGFQSMAWPALSQRLHPEALAYMRLAVTIVLDADTTGWALDHLLGGVDRPAYDGMDDGEVFRRTMRGITREMPGLLSSLVSREGHVLGTVTEGDDTAHVVSRVRALVQGAEPRVEVITLVRTPAGWRVRYAEELEVLHTAIRGIPIPHREVPSG